MAWQRRRACKVDWTFQTEEWKVAFAKAQNHGSVFFCWGATRKSVSSVCRVWRGGGRGVSVRVDLGSLPMGNVD